MSEKHGSHWLEREDIGDVTVVRLKAPRLTDDDTTRDLFDQMSTLVSAMGRTRIVLNLARVEMVASLGLGKMIMLNRRVQAAGGRLVLCNLTPFVAEVLETARVSHVFSIRENEGQAVQAQSWTAARRAHCGTVCWRKVLHQLVSADVLRPTWGPGGGFALARDPEDVTLLDVVEAVDGPLRGEKEPKQVDAV
jgi:anti-sigma B factor antagonist